MSRSASIRFLLSTGVVFLMQAAGGSARADSDVADCSCVGLAGNFPGFSLFCDGSLTFRTLWMDRDTDLARLVCEAARDAALSKPVVGYAQCECRSDSVKTDLVAIAVDPSAAVKHSRVLHSYSGRGFMYGNHQALWTCLGQRREMVRVGLCPTQ